MINNLIEKLHEYNGFYVTGKEWDEPKECGIMVSITHENMDIYIQDEDEEGELETYILSVARENVALIDITEESMVLCIYGKYKLYANK